MAAVLISESRWYDAMDAARRLIQIPSAAVIGHTLAGVVHHNTGESEEAVNDFDQVMALDPELKQMPLKPRSMFWSEYGRNLILIGRTEDAKRYLHRALARVTTRRSPIFWAKRTLCKERSKTPNSAGGWRSSSIRLGTARGGGWASSSSREAVPRKPSSRFAARPRCDPTRLVRSTP